MNNIDLIINRSNTNFFLLNNIKDNLSLNMNENCFSQMGDMNIYSELLPMGIYNDYKFTFNDIITGSLFLMSAMTEPEDNTSILKQNVAGFTTSVNYCDDTARFLFESIRDFKINIFNKDELYSNYKNILLIDVDYELEDKQK